MDILLEKATKMLAEGDFTCVVIKGEKVYTSKLTGIAPWLKWLEEKEDLKGAVVADRIIGKAAAMLLVLANIKAVYAPVMSFSAIEVLEQNGIDYSSDTKVEKIINRMGTDICPMEKTVANITTPTEALKALREKVRMLKKE